MGVIAGLAESLRERFLRLDLRGKITAALLTAVLGIAALVTATMYVAARSQIISQTQALLEARANLEQREIELKLANMVALAESLASNTVTANALTDSQGRDVYLTPLLRNQPLGVTGASLSVVDYRGQVVASSVQPAPDYDGEPSFALSMRSGRPAASLLRAPGQDATLLLALPIRYRLTDNIEGGVLLHIPLAPLLGSSTPTDARWLVDASGAQVAGGVLQRDAIQANAPLTLPEVLDEFKLTLMLTRNGADALRTLNLLLIAFLLTCPIIVGGVVVFARAGARFITTPLGELAAAAEQIAASGRPVAHLPARRDDEFGRLSFAFNTMVDRLAESYADIQRRAHATHDALVLSSTDAFIGIDSNGRIMEWSPMATQMFGWSAAQVIGQLLTENIIPLRHHQAHAQGLARIAQGGAPHIIGKAMELSACRADGTEISVELMVTPVLLESGQNYMAFVRDITERHESEERIRDRTEQLNAIFSLSPDGFVSFDLARCVKYVNPAFVRMTGLDESEMIGLDEAAFSERLSGACVPEANFSGTVVLRAMNKAGAEGTAAPAVSERRQKIEIAGAGKRVLEVALRESEAATVSQILYLRDVTHETEVERLKSEFVSTAAHELRTPMASVYGFAELLLARDLGEADRRDFLVTIFKQSELIVSIINELLDLARIEARRGKDFTFERVNIHGLLQEIVAGFKMPAGRVSPKEPPANGALSVRADRKKLTQAVINVLSNAYKYSPAGSAVDIEFVQPAPGVQYAPDSRTPLVGIRITDHGIGMTPEQLGRVFERFYRADISGKIPGTGLGMSIVHEIVVLHGGEVNIDSKFGAGTTVTIWLPAAAANAPVLPRRRLESAAL